MSEIVDLGAKRDEAAKERGDIAAQHQAVVASNVRLIGQLGLLGKQLDRAVHIQAAVEVLIDLCIGADPDELAAFHFAVDSNLHEKLQQAVKESAPG